MIAATDVRDGIDLHLHTLASDGRWTPAGLVARAVRAGIGTIAVTDHDTVASVAEVATSTRASGITAIAGVEVTVHWRGVPLHLLAYGDAVTGPEVGAILARGRDAIDAWVRDRVTRLPDGLARHALASSGTPLTITALVRAARASALGTDMRDALRMVGTLLPGSPPGLDLADVARALGAAGAITILAHPMREGSLTRALDLQALGSLLDEVPEIEGIEVAHPGHPLAVRSTLAALATRRAMLVTAGSDSHGPARGRLPFAWPADLARAFLDRCRATN